MAAAPLVLLCNKQDVEGAMSAPMIAEKFDLDNRIYDRFFACQACSGKTGEGIPEALDFLVEKLSLYQ